MKHLATLLMLMAISTMASAQLVKENFDYPAGEAIDSLGWTAHSGIGNQPALVSSSGLTYTGYAGSGVGNALNVFSTGEDVNKGFPDQTKDGETIYLSALVDITESANSVSGGYFLHLGDRASPTSFSSFCARVFVKVDASGNVGFGLGNTATGVYGTTSFSKNTTYLLIVKYTINVAGNDTTKLWVIPSGVPASEAAAGTPEVTVSTQAGQNSVNAVAIRQNSGIPDVVIDGIRVATTWENSVGGVDAPVAWFSPDLVDFGNVYVGSSKTDSVVVGNAGYAALSIASATPSGTMFTVTPSSASIPAHDSLKFAVKYTPTTAQVDSQNVAFVSNASSSPDTVIVKGVAKVPGFSVLPKSLDFGNVWKDSTATDTLFVTNKSTTDNLVIDSVHVTDTVFTISKTTATIAVSATDTILVSFKPAAKGLKSASIVFFHDFPAVGDTVKVSGTGMTHEPGFMATPDSLDFHNVLVGKSVTDTVTVKNDGYDSLFISAVTSTNAKFTVTPTSARLDSMAVKKFVITFTPAVVGPDSSAIAFTSNTAQGTDTVWVRGSGANVSSIADARKDANNDFRPDNLGETFFVAGVVTSLNFQAPPKTGYFMQDASAGINIFSYDSTPSPLAVGDSIFVIGKIQQYRGLTEITPLKMDTANIKILKHNAAVPKPKVITVSEFNTNPEKYEGSLIEMDSLNYSSGTWPAEGSNGYPYYKTKNGTDSVLVFINQYTQIDGTTQQKDPVNFIGVVSQYTSSSSVYDDGYELMPRDTSDIKPVTPSAITGQTGTIPREFYLSQNYPNPFNPSTTIDFGLPKETQVRIAVYNILGQRVATLVDGTLKAGSHMINFNASRLASGVYFYVMQTGEKMFKGKMLLMK